MKFSIKQLLMVYLFILSHTIFCMDNEAKTAQIFYCPWREDYPVPTKELIPTPENKPCVFCKINHNNNDTKDLILYRGKNNFIALAMQPYIFDGTHLLIIPNEHTRELSELTPETVEEMNLLTYKIGTIFSDTCNTIYINTNHGLTAGASVPGHHHRHLVINNKPRCFNLIKAIEETPTTLDLPLLFQTIQPKLSLLKSLNILQPIEHTAHKNNCYFCSTIQAKTVDSQNLIIHRGKYATIMLSHFPTALGDIDILPNHHIESLEKMPLQTYNEINQFTVKIYPLLLRILNRHDSNIGFISYGENALPKEHLRQKIVSRNEVSSGSPILECAWIVKDIKKLYEKLVLAWKEKLLQR